MAGGLNIRSANRVKPPSILSRADHNRPVHDLEARCYRQAARGFIRDHSHGGPRSSPRMFRACSRVAGLGRASRQAESQG